MARKEKYSRVFVRAYLRHRQQLGKAPLPDHLDITREELESAARELDVTIGNMPDLPYSLRSRQGLPEEVTRDGYNSLEIIGKSLYRLHRKSPELDDLLSALPPIKEERVLDGTPDHIKSFIGEDEQDILAVVRYSKLISIFLEADATHWKSHWRTTGNPSAAFLITGRGAYLRAAEEAEVTRPQVEVDDMYVASSSSRQDPTRKETTLVPMEAKAPRESFSPTQILPILRALHSKFPGIPIRPVLLHHEGEGRLLLVEFNGDAQSPSDLRALYAKRYVIYPKPQQW